MSSAVVGRLKEKVVLVTAAAQGIGRAAAEAFAKEGASVYATDINEAKLKELEDVQGVTTKVLDVTNKAAVEGLLAQIPIIDVLFNCAGIVPSGSILEVTDEDFKAVFDINVKSVVYLCQAVIPKMQQNRKGCIINMASVASSIKGAPNRCIYSASKAAVIALTKSVAVEFVDDGIRCNCICPGTVDTPSLRERLAASGDYEGARKQFVARQKMGRLGKPEEIAALAVYMASDESSFTTGQEFIIDGGWSM